MSRLILLFRMFVLYGLNLLFFIFLFEGLKLAWQGAPIQGILVVMAACVMLAVCLLWLLPPTDADEAAAEPSPPSHPHAQEPHSRSIRTPTRYKPMTSKTILRSATADKLRAALLGIGMQRIAGAVWQEAIGDKRWKNLYVFLHCKRDKLGERPDDIVGLYLTREDAEAAAAASPQTGKNCFWKMFVAAIALRHLIDDSKVLPHLVSTIKKELFKLPAGECPGTLAELPGLCDGKAWMDANSRRVVLFEDENALGRLMFSGDPKTCAFKTDSGVGLFIESGIISLPPRFEDVRPFYSGLAAVKLQGRWGFVVHGDHWQIEPRFLELDAPFCGNDNDKDYARARTENGWGLIDRQGVWVVADRYAEIGKIIRYRIDLSFAAVRKEKNGLWGAIEISPTDTAVIESMTQQGNELIVGATAAAYNETLVIDYVCATEDDVKDEVYEYTMRTFVCRLRDPTEAVRYHCARCGRQIGDYAAVRHSDSIGRVFCSDECSTEAFWHPSREYEKRGGDY